MYKQCYKKVSNEMMVVNHDFVSHINFSQLSPCGHLAIMDTPPIRTAAKSSAKVSHLTETNSRYYGLLLLWTYRHFVQSQRHNFIDSEQNFLTLAKQ